MSIKENNDQVRRPTFFFGVVLVSDRHLQPTRRHLGVSSWTVLKQKQNLRP